MSSSRRGGPSWGSDNMSSSRRGGPSWGSDEQSSSDPNSSSDTFQGAPLNVQAMMEERRKSRSRPRQVLTALRSSLTRHSADGSSFDDDDGNKNRRKSLFRKGSREGSNGGNESVGSGSDIGGGLVGDSQMTHRRRDTKTTFKLPHFLSQASPVPSNDDTDHHRQVSKDRGESDESKYAKTIRRYGVGQYVLISNHNLDEGSSCLVNRYGFPEGGGGALYSEQRRGPYVYLLAQVKSVHFGEDAQYYTVSRCDNEEDQRADAGWMEPITDTMGIEAAKIAAKKLCNGASTNVQSHSDSVFLSSLEKGTKRCIHGLCIGMSLLQRKIKDQATKCLNGNRPYKISFKFTGVNFLVLSSIWYLYIDQMRLAFFPHSADFACAIVSCVVWFILVIELIMEVFIRPSEWRALIRSEKAFLPSTCRYLSTFHLIAEAIALILFIPEFMCVFTGDGGNNCGAERRGVTLGELVTKALFGPTKLDSFYGNAYLCTMRLRIFGLVRHWTKMWLNSTFVLEKGKTGEWHIKRGKGLLIPQGKHIRPRGEAYAIGETGLADSLSMGKSTVSGIKEAHDVKDQKHATSDDYHLTNASKIGTALFMTNARRALLWLFLIGLMPLILVAFTPLGGIDSVWTNSVEILQENNIGLNDTSADSCEFLRQTVEDWVATVGIVENRRGVHLHLLHLTLEPVRCDNLNLADICMFICQPYSELLKCDNACKMWTEDSWEERLEWYEDTFDVRPNDVVTVRSEVKPMRYSLPNGTVVEADFFIEAQFNETAIVTETNIKIYSLQLLITICILLWLSILRFDAGRFVLGPLRRMLKIVAWYAKNPLLPLPKRERNFDASASKRSSIYRRQSIMSQNEIYYESDDDETIQQLGNFETDALVNTVTTITDLMRRCWGVAGANIISANLARQEGGLASSFNPTVPGEAAYALFAFIGINNFDNHLNALKDDIMILINDIAAVLHEEVYRWGYEDSGQCNKNLGGAFLMVYKIGAVKEVIEKLEQAEAVIFSRRTTKVRRRRSRRSILSSKRASTNSTLTRAPADRMSGNHLDSIDLSSLPGMRAFTDRALLGLLKTFVGIHRDKTILEWNDDFRLGAGVGAASIDLLFGMDAGWAVEGAVGSEYKIDATYLSPHVNMASRMMSATKQYGVHFLLSERVQKLLSENAKGTLRHLDTVTVKGSSVPLKIFTYDAKVRHDFFLYSRTESQADLDSERYSTSIWHTDQDLCAMRSHVSDEFIVTFTRGREEYLAGNWPQAIELLLQADNLMFEAQLEEGYNTSLAESSFRNINMGEYGEESQERLALGDGPCQNLIVYMKSRGGVAPKNWDGYRALTSK